MNTQRLADLFRTLAVPSRRLLLAALWSAILAALGGDAAAVVLFNPARRKHAGRRRAARHRLETERRKKKRKKKKKKKRNQPPSSPSPPPQQPPPQRQPLTRTFTSPAAIDIPGTPGSTVGTALPYPATIEVSGFTNGVITDVNIFFANFTHTAPTDVDILLTATQIPDRNAFIMSEAGSVNDVLNLTLRLDDQAAVPLPIPGPLFSGTFRPVNHAGSGTDTFPTPAPTPTGSSQLSTFNGRNPNGTWQLWVVDDETPDTGSIIGWGLEITAEVDV